MEDEVKAVDSVGIPSIREGLKMEDDVSVTLPAWVWAVACVQLQAYADDSSYIGAVLVRAQEALMHPAYLVARQIKHEQQMEVQQKMAEAAQQMFFRQMPGSEEDDG